MPLEHFAQHNRSRPTVEEDVVAAPEKLMAVVLLPYERDAERGRSGDVESALTVLRESLFPGRTPFVGRPRAPIVILDRQRSIAGDYLHRMLQVCPVDGAPQRGMSSDGAPPGVLEDVRVKKTVQPAAQQEDTGIIRRVLQPVEKHALLHRRKPAD